MKILIEKDIFIGQRIVVNSRSMEDMGIIMPQNKENEREAFVKFMKYLKKKSNNAVKYQQEDLEAQKIAADYAWFIKVVEEYIDEKY